MERIEGLPLNQLSELQNPTKLYYTLMGLIVELAKHGLIHGDFNEFNILIRSKDESPVIIDFPQTVSIKHRNAEEYFLYFYFVGYTKEILLVLTNGFQESFPWYFNG